MGQKKLLGSGKQSEEIWLVMVPMIQGVLLILLAECREGAESHQLPRDQRPTTVPRLGLRQYPIMAFPVPRLGLISFKVRTTPATSFGYTG
jgi:hypothetical protein